MTDMQHVFDLQEQVPQRDWLEYSHIFRSKLIERCAQIERWAVRTCEAISASDGASAKLLGQKIECVRDLARRHPDRFGNAARVIGRLDQFQAYADLRNELAHATTNVIMLANGEVQVQFQNAGQSHALIDRRIILTGDSMANIARELADICNQIQQLVIKAAP